jgi:hypothetical protein
MGNNRSEVVAVKGSPCAPTSQWWRATFKALTVNLPSDGIASRNSRPREEDRIKIDNVCIFRAFEGFISAQQTVIHSPTCLFQTSRQVCRKGMRGTQADLCEVTQAQKVLTFSCSLDAPSLVSYIVARCPIISGTVPTSSDPKCVLFQYRSFDLVEFIGEYFVAW